MTKIYKVEMRIMGTNCVVYVDAKSVDDAVALATENDGRFEVVKVSCQTPTLKGRKDKNMIEMILIAIYVILGTPLLIAMGYCLYDWFIK